MSIEDILKSGGEVTVTVKSADLKEFAEHLVRKTIDGFKQSVIKPDTSYLTADEVMKELKVNRSTLWRWNKIGYLCHVEVGGKRLYKNSDIDLILQK